MPCNKVAVVKARVDNEHVAGLLTTATLFPVVNAYVAAKMYEIGHLLPDRTTLLRENNPERLCFRLGGYYGIDIMVKRGGEIEISHTNAEQTRFDAILTSELLTIMAAVGVNLLKAEIAQFVQQNFGIEELFQRADGTVVINFTC
ncbi:MAG: hypothetical protein DLM69_00215 [Candidatus Chloroheliales bacterium]|nr:MAG: hypothetical protein DLM69_00215 [Chloroflexota bacterium]